ncbi:hypothetical protein K470DRAFT_161738 [Piedraia hortae CBS 480.64]|uniref:Uncharacterized protein n=1 Tax=Piedraia hortae CBS 480.64 TaxID=1314780 RepID=A0A6A7BQS5_9PEZI|nr:hypothetical protein K470DRAFT_161738 [Piedraia hortae CBS 480.64]
MRIFLNISYHAVLNPAQFHALFPRMLTGRSEQFYKHYVGGVNLRGLEWSGYQRQKFSLKFY